VQAILSIHQAVATLMKQPASSPVFATSIHAGDFEHHLAVVVPFHWLQRLGGASLAYSWGEERHAALLKREVAWPM
jgi:hypothetical protein